MYALAAVATGWVFFRAETLDQALAYLLALAGRHTGSVGQPVGFFVDNELLLVLALAALGSTPWPKRAFGALTAGLPGRVSVPGVLLGAMALLILCGAKVAAGAYSPFIYFRF